VWGKETGGGGMNKEEEKENYEAVTQRWIDRLSYPETTKTEKVLIDNIIFQRKEVLRWKEAFYRMEEELKTEKLKLSGCSF
jgi:hypothetical protein